jgi:hypothetical protein
MELYSNPKIRKSSYYLTLPKLAIGGKNISKPINSALPAITGTARVGQTLTASAGKWTNSPSSFTYQWNRAGTPINGATNSTYVLQKSDLGALITVAVTAMNRVGAGAPALSALAGPVISTTADYVSSSAGLDTNPGTLAVNYILLSPPTS